MGGVAILGAKVDLSAITKLDTLQRRHVRYLLEKLRELQRNLETKRLTGDTPIFYNEALSTREKNRKGVNPENFPRLFKAGLRRIRDFFDADGRTITVRDAIDRGLGESENDKFEWERMTLILGKRKKDIEPIHNPTWSLESRSEDSEGVPILPIGEQSVIWTEATQKKILRMVASERKVEYTPHQKRLILEYGIEEDEWSRLHKYVKKHSIATRKREFLYKMICMGPYTNTDYHRFKIKSSSKCQYCEEPKQDFKHLFQECELIKDLRERMAIRWDIKPSDKEWIIGMKNDTAEEKAVTFIVFELNHYIQIENWKGEELSLAAFKGKLRAIENVERRIAMKNNKINIHERKWEDIFQLIR